MAVSSPPHPKQQRDKAATQAALLSAAETLFAAHGFAATTMDMLAAESGVNKALISYYFGSKEGLYDAAVAAMVDGVIAEIPQAATTAQSADEDLRHWIMALGEALAGRPTFPAVLLREYIGGRGMERASPFAKVMQFFSRTKAIYERGHAAGLFREMDPHKLHLSIIAPLVHFSVTMRFRERTLPAMAPTISDPAPAEFAAHHADLILKGLAIE